MDVEAILTWVDSRVLTRTGQRLSDLQRTIFQQVWQGAKYPEIALQYGCTEGHAKDVGAALWQLLSKELGEKITKSNCRTAIARHLKSAIAPVPPLSQPALQPRFLGRELAIAHLNTLVQQGSKLIVIQGEGGLGKTTLAQQYLQTQGFEMVLELLMAKEPQHLTSAERVVEEWLKHDFGVEPGTEFGVSLARLKRQLHTRRVGILLDNLEPALDAQGRLIAPHRSYVELLRVLADGAAQCVTLVTSRDRLCESSLNATHYRLPGLTRDAWQQFFQSRQIAIDPDTLTAMHRAYGGNAKAMGLLAGVIQEDFERDMVAYWQAQAGDLLGTADLKDLVANQVDRLRSLVPQAYRLFYRLGCYRYQDVPTLPIQGLTHLLWDVPAAQHRSIIDALRNRSLLESHNGSFWLHPVMRAEAIARLRNSDEWETVNQKAAEFWTTKITTIERMQDALQALEAYYHWIEIHDFLAAARVILKSRNNQWKQYLPLGSTLYRMGLIQPVITAMNQVIDALELEDHAEVEQKLPKNVVLSENLSYCLSELHNILGDVYSISGRVHEAIACQQKTIQRVTTLRNKIDLAVADKHTRYCLKMLEIDALLSIGLYKIDLWELQDAAQQFQQVIQQARHTEHHGWAEKATICLALVNSYLGDPEAETLARSIVTDTMIEQAGRFAYFTQILGQTYINLGNLKPASQMLQTALQMAETGHYTQIRARALTGIAEIHRFHHEFEQAKECHAIAIDLLEQIGAKCDLAEAQFQQGITYQKMKDFEQSQTCFSQAVQLFQAIPADQQVEKVLSTSAYYSFSHPR